MLNLELWSSTNATTAVVAKITRERGWRVERKCLCVIFCCWSEDREFMEKMHFGASCWAIQWSWFAQVNALCNLSHRKSWEAAVSLLGQFLSRRCFTLCITMEVEPRTAKQYKFHHCCSCKNYQGKGMEGGKKSVCITFWLTQTFSQVCGKNAFWGIL